MGAATKNARSSYICTRHSLGNNRFSKIKNRNGLQKSSFSVTKDKSVKLRKKVNIPCVFCSLRLSNRRRFPTVMILHPFVLQTLQLYSSFRFVPFHFLFLYQRVPRLVTVHSPSILQYFASVECFRVGFLQKYESSLMFNNRSHRKLNSSNVNYQFYMICLLKIKVPLGPL